MPAVFIFPEYHGFSVYVEGLDESGRSIQGKLRYFLKDSRGPKVLESDRKPLPIHPEDMAKSPLELAEQYAHSHLRTINLFLKHQGKPSISVEGPEGYSPVDSSPHLRN